MSYTPQDSTPPRRIIAPLGAIYDRLSPLAEPLLRVTTGLLLVPHGAQKLFGAFGGYGIEGTAGYFTSISLNPGLFWAWYIGILEFFGGILLALGLFTRPVAALITGFMAGAVLIAHGPNGFFNLNGGFEFPLLWGVATLYFTLRGGGRYALDHKIGREF
jgi:putative oxidoreductase